MIETRQIEWLNQNSLRNYPFAENAQRRPTLGESYANDLAIPNYLIVDFVMTTGDSVSTDLYLMKMVIAGDSVTFVIGSGTEIAATVFVDTKSHVQNTPYVFHGINAYDAARGCLVVGDVARFRSEYPDGVYNFSKDETIFEQRCIRPSARCVSSLSVYDSVTGHVSKKLHGDVRLVAGSNIALTYDESSNAIVVSADSNEEYNEECKCGGRSPIYTINGISAQDITIVGDDCVSVTKSGHTLKISDKCSKPCCGCAELEFINEKISQITTAVNKLDNYTTVMSTRLTELQSSFIQANTGKVKG
jgi:hypothetical protein